MVSATTETKQRAKTNVKTQNKKIENGKVKLETEEKYIHNNESLSLGRSEALTRGVGSYD